METDPSSPDGTNSSIRTLRHIAPPPPPKKVSLGDILDSLKDVRLVADLDRNLVNKIVRLAVVPTTVGRPRSCTSPV
ncbi:hypothetical protein BST61_g6309 [Cercospora zeina]